MRTGTITGSGAQRRPSTTANPFLFIALRCDHPTQPGARFCLEGVETVSIGRLPALSATREGSELRIGIPDGHVSSAHLRLLAGDGRWTAEDSGSKNGTFLDGKRISREPLGDGALVEIGHTFLLFRAALPARRGADIVDARPLLAAQGFATLSPSFAEELERLRAVAASRVPVLLRGESGAGKEVLAAAIHRLSGRPGPFQAVNCGAIPSDLVESELFGHRKGAFSGAIEDHLGLVRGSDRGTLLLDEIGDLPLPAQAALLRVLEQEEVLAVGAPRPVKVDLRVVSATNRDLETMVAQQQFRADLLARLAGYVFGVPPLRERREDFSLIVAALLAKIGSPSPSFTTDAARALLRYRWPLNVRELEKCLASAVALARGEPIDLTHLPPAVRECPAPAAAPTVDERQRDELIAQLRAHDGNVTAVARAMGKARTQVQRWLRRFGLDAASFKR
ncbi:MAG TPA: sigma 54-interacting transcriptional regulator [Myxococcales bacterium]|nr:sigma 54-interacting transcriptional regulator [Myxococcales bacterium]